VAASGDDAAALSDLDGASDTNTVGLAPARFAALVAPAIDRVFRDSMLAARERGGRDLVARHGGSEAVGFLIEFRTALAWPDRVVRSADFEAVLRYRDVAAARQKLAMAAELGTIELTPEGDVRATARGREFLDALYNHHAATMAQLVDEPSARVGRVVEALGVVLATIASAPTPTRREQLGSAFAAMAPPFEPTAASPGLLLLNRLGTLRYHRADAHAAAWRAAGLNAAQIVALAPGAARDAVEAETNHRAAPPFAALSAPDRLSLLADLAALPE
jgi:hypothetical protein